MKRYTVLSLVIMFSIFSNHFLFASEHKEVKYKEVDGISFEFIKIPLSLFYMNDEVITIKPFFFMTAPVTQQLYEAIMGENPSWPIDLAAPVSLVAYGNAMEFLEKLNAKGVGVFRLPSAKEWEYVRRIAKYWWLLPYQEGGKMAKDWEILRGTFYCNFQNDSARFPTWSDEVWGWIRNSIEIFQDRLCEHIWYQDRGRSLFSDSEIRGGLYLRIVMADESQ